MTMRSMLTEERSMPLPNGPLMQCWGGKLAVLRLHCLVDTIVIGSTAHRVGPNLLPIHVRSTVYTAAHTGSD